MKKKEKKRKRVASIGFYQMVRGIHNPKKVENH